MHHRGMYSRLTNLQISTTRLHSLFMCDILDRWMCMKICYVQYLLPTSTTGTELFQSLDVYISGQLKCSICAGICTDGAAAMTGLLCGLIARMKAVAPESQSTVAPERQSTVAPESQSTHCITHRETLANRKM